MENALTQALNLTDSLDTWIAGDEISVDQPDTTLETEDGREVTWVSLLS